MKNALAVLATLSLFFSAAFAGDGAEWFAVSGVSFVEAVGTGETYVIVSRDGASRFAIWSAGEEFAPGMTVKKIGSQQVLVARANGEQAAAPILRQQIPADVLIAAICRLYSQNLVVAGEIPQMVGFSEGLLNYKAELPGLLKSLGMTYEIDDRAVVIRKPEAKRPLPGKASRGEGSYQGRFLRDAVKPIFDACATATQRTFVTKNPAAVVTVHSADLSLDELAGYLAAATDADITELKAAATVAAPPPPVLEAKATATPEPAAPKPAAASPEVVEKAFRQAVTIARAGDYKKSAGLLLRIVRARPEAPAKVSNLLGKLLWSLGRHEMARKAWMHTLKHEPANDFARKALARTATDRT